ncbi:transcription factor MYB98-like [Hibiscus syriacus]|uniref:transcription factor MYB98-like n=1 Tax=Hibiscus syriacus TaxID=106335 RepID=UPI0019238B15|nr:transcription factor MYB98-like [Hibiscus syriacus]
MEFDPKHGENMSPQGQQPMLLSDNCLKPFETTIPSSSSKDYYLQDFHHLDHDHQIHVNGSSSNPVYVYDSLDAFPYSCSSNSLDFYECKPIAAAADHGSVGHGQIMDNFESVGLLNLCHQRNLSNDIIIGSDVGNYMAAPFDFVVADAMSSVTAENGYCNKNRALANSTTRRTTNWKGRKKSNGVKGQWTMEEDRLLIQLVEQYGVRKWSHIAQMLPGRIGKQCRERWHNHLRPDIKKDTWSEEEDKVLIQSHIEIGNKWAEIAKRLPGRTENSIKNHWNATKRRQFSKRKCRSKYPRGSILQEYIKSLNLESSSSARSQEKSLNATEVPADKSSIKPLDFCPSTDRLVPEYVFNEFSFDEKLLQESCSIDSLLDQIPAGAAAPMAGDKSFEMDMGPVKKELDLVEMISAHPITSTRQNYQVDGV